MQSDWMIGECVRGQRADRVQLVPDYGCTCAPWDDTTERAVRARLQAGSCSFLQFPGHFGSRGGPFKDLMSMLRHVKSLPAVVHQLDRLV